jgi:CAAX prenyl protease-like protein
MVTGAFALGLDPYYSVRALPVLAVFWFFRRDYRELFRGLSLRRAILWGLVGLAIWLTLSVPESLPRWAYLSDRAATSSPALEMTGIGGVAWIATRAALSSTLVPVVEELAFRGYLLRRLMQREFEEVPFTRVSPLALVASSLVFGLLHDAWLAGTAVGLLFGWVQSRTGSLANAVVAHAVANTGVAIYVLVSGDWSQWL